MNPNNTLVRMYQRKDRTVQLWELPEECRCHTMHVLFINTGGQTYCPHCLKDEEETNERVS
jgi:hypothetical protein